MENHSNINNMFIPYELALKLKNIGFDDKCLAYYSNKDGYLFFSTVKEIPDEFTLAPLWQQAWSFLEDNFGMHSSQDNLLNDFSVVRTSKEKGIELLKYMDTDAPYCTREELRLKRLNFIIDHINGNN